MPEDKKKQLRKFKKKIREIEQLEKITDRELNEHEKQKVESKAQVLEMLENLSLDPGTGDATTETSK